MNYKAIVTDKETRKRKIIESSYNSKQAFIADLRANGYSVDPDKVRRLFRNSTMSRTVRRAASGIGVKVPVDKKGYSANSEERVNGHTK